MSNWYNQKTDNIINSGDYLEIKVLPWGLKLKYRPGDTVLQALHRGGIYVENPCGGRGTCGKCKVIVTPAEGGASREVLSCQEVLVGDAVVEVPLENEYVDTKSGMSSLSRKIELDSCVKIKEFNLKQTGDSYEEELRRQLNIEQEGQEAEHHLELLRVAAPSAGEDITMSAVTVDGVPVDIQPGAVAERRLLGVAIDLGTTTVMGALMDLQDGTSLATTSRENLQKYAGADVISRAQHVMQAEENLEELRRKTAQTINGIIEELLGNFPARQEDIYELVVVGNTTMLHFFLGISPRSLVLAPYHPFLRRQASVSAAKLGVNINPRGRVYTAPSVSGYVGADPLAAALATGLHLGEHPRLLIDIGTNGEMVMGWKGRLAACSTAAGPAFEGARLRHGMRGVPGAIERVDIQDEKLEIGVIAGETPRGICGSGLVDAVAAFLEAGIIAPMGKLASPDDLPPGLKERLVDGEKGKKFMLANPEESATPEGVSLDRRDIGELQLAKGAICAGVKIMLQHLELEMEDLEEVLLAGAFGNYLRKEKAAAIGVWPNYPVEKVKGVGNAAGIGAQMMLLSSEMRREAEALSQKIEHLNLASHPNFTREFTNAMMLKNNI